MLSQINNSGVIKAVVIVLALVIVTVAGFLTYGAVHQPSEPTGVTCTISGASGTVTADCTED